MDQKIINLYDRFTHGGNETGASFLDPLGRRLAGSSAAAVAPCLPLLQNDYAPRPPSCPADDGPARCRARFSYDSPKGRINGYLVRLKAKGKAAGRPSSPSTRTAASTRISRDVARRLAVEGLSRLLRPIFSR